jgi:LAO/AO transport system kinase
MISIEKVLEGDTRTLAKAISLVEDDPVAAGNIIKKLYSRTGKAFVVGVTGPPGTGKSTLVNGLIKAYRHKEKAVGVLAVDPTSPFSGGALLGDRVRMLEHSGDTRVFIRSIASRGSIGGLSRATADTVKLLDASGKDVVLLETVGIGQADIEVVGVANAVVVVLMPELGDEIQGMKAGLMEIGDIFVVNKADLENADRAALQLRMSIVDKNGWRPPGLKTIATAGEGIDELVRKLDEFNQYVSSKGIGEKLARRRLQRELENRVTEKLMRRVAEHLSSDPLFQEVVSKVATKEIDPHTAVETFLSRKKRFF